MARYHLEQGRFASAIGANYANNAARWQAEGEVFEQELVAISLGEALGFDNFAAQPLWHLDNDLRLTRLALGLGVLQSLKLAQTGLGFGLTPLGVLPNPVEFF